VMPLVLRKHNMKVLEEYDQRDKAKVAIESSKNDLESYIYDTKAKLLDDDEFIAHSTEEEREAVEEALSHATIWLEEEGESGTLAQFVAKKADLVSTAEAIVFRLTEMTSRPQAVQHCQQILNFSRLYMENITKTQNVTEEELEQFLDEVQEVEEWLDVKVKEQEPLPAYQDPILTSEQIITKCRAISQQATKLMKRPKLKPPPKPKKETIKTDEEETGADADTEESGESQQEVNLEEEETHNSKEEIDQEEPETHNEEEHPEL